MEEYLALRGAAGWHLPSPSHSAAALEASLAGVVAVSADRRTVGMARVIGDGALYALLVDVVVAPDHQHQGIGSTMVTRLTAWAQRRRIPHTSLAADEEAVGFYLRAGFAPAGQYLRFTANSR
ncbi:GNAT family N-acetyltransferase [Nocardia abscessus]|uniref:GNAT family N-acetyltransferase n=1 Tax=Nocardia abscessus TaxID=120957 RepID=UPI001894E64A|nr:GNAT family N-acetyltransferase [Nocardia abscessus]MBF6339770.1 GNAT family N-acetyltransferase [Nocardia abscessus]